MTMCSILMVICLFSGITWTFAVSEVLFSIEQPKNNFLSCKQTQEKPGKAIVLENDDIKLSVKNSPEINYFQCYRYNEPNSVFVKNPEKSPRKSVTSLKATTQMSGLWECRILTNRNVDIEPVKYDSELNANFTELFCHVNVHVRLLETPQTVLINNMVLPTERMDYTEEYFDHSAKYNYLNGDIVTVACIPGSNILKENTDTPYTIVFQYDFAENLNNKFKELNTSSSLGYGFRTKLQTRHNNTVMICKCSKNEDDHTTVKVTFVLTQTIQSTGYITVNGLIARPLQSTKNNNDLNVKLNYLFFDVENVEVVCNGNDLLIAVGKQEECKTGGQTFTQQLSNKNSFEYNCFLCDHVSGIVREHITVIAKGLATNFKENKRLDVVLPSDKILIELFKYDETDRRSWIYYEFEEDEEVELKCTYSKDKISNAELEVRNISNIQELKTSTRVTLSSEDDDKYFECQLIEVIDPRIQRLVIYKHITVLFRKRLLTTTPTTMTSTSSTIQIELKITEGPQFNGTQESQLAPFVITKWAIAAGAVLVCIVLCCVFITIWKMRKRSQMRDSCASNYENLQNQNSQTSIPPYPEQWSQKEEQNYHVPVDIYNNSNIYAEPVRGPDDPYATPIPKSQRPLKGSQYDPGPTYAELDIGTGSKTKLSNFGDPQYSSVKELYSQVVPKNLRPSSKTNYDNVFPDSRYVNSESSEYVEPTYSQAYKK